MGEETTLPFRTTMNDHNAVSYPSPLHEETQEDLDMHNLIQFGPIDTANGLSPDTRR
ncbi:hypothetical protein LTR16_011469, partial [Cryomyces antarcticus]